MKETGLLLRGPLIQATLDGRKTMTRRIVKPQPPFGCIYGINGAQTHAICCAADNHAVWVPPTPKSKDHRLPCPYGGPGDLLWFRETWRTWESLDHIKPSKIIPGAPVEYAAGGNNVFGWENRRLPGMGKWCPSIFMPRWASRIIRQIVSVRVERLQDITEEDAKAEGAQFGFWHPKEGVFTEPVDEEDEQNSCFRDGFGFVWESINGPGSWELNPWVWVIEFKERKP